MSDEDNLVIDQNDEEKKEVDENLKMIKIDDVDESLRKNLNLETIFKFQCENVDNKLRLGLKEINKFSPYYYERFFTKEELDEINDTFRALRNIDAVKKQLLRCFQKRATLNEVKGSPNLNIHFKIPNFDEVIEIDLEVERKTIEDKDAGIMTLFGIQKKNIAIINKIKEKCLKEKKEKTAQMILEAIEKEPPLKLLLPLLNNVKN
jgi:hypothetical protein